MADGMTTEAVSFQLRLRNPPSVHVITTTRRFIEELCEPLLGQDGSSLVAMAVHELMENLAKYAEDGSMRLEVEVRSHQNEYQICITAMNRASPQRLAALEEILKDVANSDDPRATHLRYMNQSVTRKEGSGLGLTRIRAEGDMRIGYSRSGDEITIRAEASVPCVRQ
jgi:two-component sensor histidine kinase